MQSIAKYVAWAATATLSSSVASAGVLTVGGPNPAFADIPAAVAAAVDGDVLLVRNGSYHAFTIDGKSISIVADSGATVNIPSASTVRNLPAGKTLLLAGLTFTGAYGSPLLKLENDAGRVRIESVSGTSPSDPLALGVSTVKISRCADVAFTACSFSGPNGMSGGSFGSSSAPAMAASTSSVTLYHCSLSGGRGRDGWVDGQGFPHDGLPGAESFLGIDVTLFARASNFHGGNGGNGLNGFGPPPSCSTPYTYATSGGNGGAGVILQGSVSTGNLVDASSVGGSGGIGGIDGCGNQIPQAPNGQQFVGPVAASAGPAIRFTNAEPAREGQNLALHFEGAPGTNVVLVLGNRGAGYTDLPPLHGVLLIQAPLRRLALGTIPPAGVLDVNLPVPLDLGPGVDVRLVHTQAVFIDTLGTSHLADPGVVVMLDSAF